MALNAAPPDAQAQRAENKPDAQVLQASYVDMLPFMTACSNATGDLDLALSAYELAYEFLDAEDAEYCNVCPLMLASQRPCRHALA